LSGFEGPVLYGEAVWVFAAGANHSTNSIP